MLRDRDPNGVQPLECSECGVVEDIETIILNRVIVEIGKWKYVCDNCME